MTNFVEEFIVGLGFEFEGEDGERFKKQTQQISSVINALSAAAAAATTALFLMSKAQGKQAYDMATTARVMDTNAQTLGKWRYAAERAGASGDSVVGMLQGLKQASQDAMRNGSGPFRAFEELGVNFQGIADGSVDVGKALEDIISKAQTMDRAMAQSGLRELGINPVLMDTPIEQLRTYMAEYEKFGGLTDNLAKKGGELDKAMAGANLRFEGAQSMLSERLIPTYVKFFEVISKGLEWVQQEGFPILDEFVEKMGGWDKILAGLALVSIPALIGALGALAKLLGVVTGGFAGAARAAALLARGAAVIGGGVVGYTVGQNLRDGREDLADSVGDYAERALNFLGLEEGKDYTRTRSKPRDPYAPGNNSYGRMALDDFNANESLRRDYEEAKRLHPEDYPEPQGGASGGLQRPGLLDRIIQKESGGRTGLTSGKGAMGLAQLMEPTARDVAAQLGVAFDKDKLLNDAGYNRMLGGAYLQNMLDKYGGNEMLATAAYNAGPGMVDDWIKGSNETGKNNSKLRLGDPRTDPISESTWIQNIPFKETRDYTYGIMNNTAGGGGGGSAGGGGRTVHNTFNGLKQSEIEAIMRDAEAEQSTLMADESRDAIVR